MGVGGGLEKSHALSARVDIYRSMRLAAALRGGTQMFGFCFD